MSHINIDDKDTTKAEATQKNYRELATSLRAMALATQDPSPVFKLNVDCWEEILDWLSLEDVHAFGQTCKFFYQIVGKYFQWKYKGVSGQVRPETVGVDVGFVEFIQSLSFYRCNPDDSLLLASASCKSPNQLVFYNTSSSDLDINRLEKMLSNVEVLIFWNEYMNSGEFIESFLKICSMNLKRLTIEISMGFGWMYYKYPKLQHLVLYECSSSDELIKFFERNPNVRSFSTAAEIILKYQKELMASNIKLDDLTISRNRDYDTIPTALINLYKRGFYKRLHFVTYTENHLADLPGLTSLHVETYNYIKMPILSTLTFLSFTPFFNRNVSHMDMGEVSNAFINLECIRFICETNLDYMMPFIRNSRRLKEIKIEYFRHDEGEIDPGVMNNQREKLTGATKVTIYVVEEDYLIIKWKYNKSDFGLIEIKRQESYDGVWDKIYGF